MLSLAVLLVSLATAQTVGAEYVVFKDGRHLKVTGTRFHKGLVEVVLTAGGQMRFDADSVRYVTSDGDVENAPRPVPPVADDPAWVAWADPRFVGPIKDIAAREGVDAALVAAVIKVESDFRPHAVSPRGAQGLMQLMPATGARYQLADPFEPEANIAAGTKHLKLHLGRYVDQPGLALAAYNAGEKAVERYGGVPPYRETKRYVEQVLALWKGVAAAKL